MIKYKKKDIWLTDFGEPVGHKQGYTRPSIVISSDMINSNLSEKLIVIPITSKERMINTHIKLSTQTGLSQTSFALIEDIKSISMERLIKHIGFIDDDILKQIHQILKYMLDFEI